MAGYYICIVWGEFLGFTQSSMKLVGREEGGGGAVRGPRALVSHTNSKRSNIRGHS